MPRQRSAARAPSRPTVSAPKPVAAPQQQRPATTYAPQHAQHAPAPPAPVASQGPGLLGQMASTAAGVAIGSSIGHAIGGFFSGSPAEPVQAAPAPVPQQAQYSANNSGANNCAGAVESFTSCMNTHNGDMSICNWYLEQLKACQAAARQY